MGKPLALSNGTILRRSSGSALQRSTQAAAAEGELVVSYYNFKQDPYVDISASLVRPQTGDVKVSGGSWRTQDLYENDLIDLDGTILSLPAGTSGIDGNEILYAGYGDYPAYYNGRTLVMERRQGKFKGSGNSMNIFQVGATLSTTTWEFEESHSGDGSTTTFAFTGVNAGSENWSANQIHVYVGGYRKQHKMKAGTDYTVAANGADIDVTFTSAPAIGTDNIFLLLHRKEFELDTDNWGTSPPRDAGPYPTYSIGTPSAVQDCMLADIFFKDEEADIRARFDTPRKMFAPWFRAYYDFPHVIRPMDLYDPMRNGAAVPADMAEVDDQSIGCKAGSSRTDYDYNVNGQIGVRQANPTLPLLDLCKNEYAAVKTPWINIPCYFGLPVYPAVLPRYIQEGTSTCIVWLRSTVVDFGQSVSLSNASHAGVATVAAGGKRIDIDASTAFTHTSGEQSFTVDVNFTDVESNAHTYTLRLRILNWNKGVSGDYMIWHDIQDAWVDNESYFDNHWCWTQWADWLLDQLEAVNWSSTDEVLLEIGNEVWNTATEFVMNTSFAKGPGIVKALGGDHNLTGHGWIAAKLRKQIDDRMAARSLSYNITDAIGTWTAWGNASVTDQKLSGYKQYWESAEGGSLSGQALLDKQAQAQVFITNYYSSPFVNDFQRNYTGLQDLSSTYSGDAVDGVKTTYAFTNAGRSWATFGDDEIIVELDDVVQTYNVDYTVALNGNNRDITFTTAPAAATKIEFIAPPLHTPQVEADFTADEETFWNTHVYNYYAATGAGTDDLTRIIWIENRYDEHHAKAQEYNTICRGSYEGGSHDDSGSGNIPSSIQAISGFMASYESHMQGAFGGTIWDLMVSRLRAKDPNFMIAAYGGPYDWTAPQAWAYGAYQTTKNAYAIAVENTGITE